jgi:hypothetical protein
MIGKIKVNFPKIEWAHNNMARVAFDVGDYGMYKPLLAMLEPLEILKLGVLLGTEQILQEDYGDNWDHFASSLGESTAFLDYRNTDDETPEDPNEEDFDEDEEEYDREEYDDDAFEEEYTEEWDEYEDEDEDEEDEEDYGEDDPYEEGRGINEHGWRSYG